MSKSPRCPCTLNFQKFKDERHNTFICRTENAVSSMPRSLLGVGGAETPHPKCGLDVESDDVTQMPWGSRRVYKSRNFWGFLGASRWVAKSVQEWFRGAGKGDWSWSLRGRISPCKRSWHDFNFQPVWKEGTLQLSLPTSQDVGQKAGASKRSAAKHHKWAQVPFSTSQRVTMKITRDHTHTDFNSVASEQQIIVTYWNKHGFLKKITWFKNSLKNTRNNICFFLVLFILDAFFLKISM